MRIMIIGGRGMAGHMIKDYLLAATKHEIWYSLRGKPDSTRGISLDVLDEQEVYRQLALIKPDIVINAVGLLNHDAERRLPEAIYVNSLFPHKLVQFGECFGYRLLHISTDCVFSGRRGSYIEGDVRDGSTMYAKTKCLGEVIDDQNLTIRTSIIGPELKEDGIGLFHWFMKQEGEISGYNQVFWNGVTTLELAKAIEWLLNKNIHGLVHLSSSSKISKYDLLHLFKSVFERNNIQINANDRIKSDKSLLNQRSDFTYAVPNYLQMIQELKLWMKEKGEYPYA